MISPDTPEDQPMLSFQPFLDLFKNDDRYEILRHIADYLGSNSRSLHLWISRGVSIVQAEKLAEKVGLHPSVIWGSDYHTAVYYEMNRQLMMDRNNKALRRARKNETVAG